jgi:protein arginine kinase activator
MQCDVCGKKKATVHLTEIVDEQMTELHLCEDCAREKSSQMEQQFGLADLLAGLADFGKQTKTPESPQAACPNCGLMYDDFRKLGRLGCSQCYESFQSHLSTLLKKIHGASHHLGKAPPGAGSAVATATTAGIVTPQPVSPAQILQGLKEQLAKVIKAEDFERAATLRDKIRELENGGA